MKNNRFQTGLACALIGLLSLACSRPESVVPQNPSDSPSEPTTEQALRVGRNGMYFTILPPITQQAIEKVIPDAGKLSILIEKNTYYYYDAQSEEGKQLEASMMDPDSEQQASARTQAQGHGHIVMRTDYDSYVRDQWVRELGQDQFDGDNNNKVSFINIDHKSDSGKKFFYLKAFNKKNYTGKSITLKAKRGEDDYFIGISPGPWGPTPLNDKISSYKWWFADN